MLNQVVISGRMARDPEVRAAGGSQVANFTVGVTNKYKDKSGEQKETTAWVRCSAWGKTAEIAGELSKGEEVVISGSLETRSWEDKDGNKRETMEVRAFSVHRCAGRNAASKPSASKSSASKGAAFDDEIPF